MKSMLRSIVFLTLTSLPAAAEKFIELDLGFAPSKSSLGASYTFDRNEINVGIKAFGFTSDGDYSIMPGITYNRYFTENGFYGSATYAPLYRSEVSSSGMISGQPYDQIIGSRDGSGWQAGAVFLGLGKTFQWKRWGINTDANLITPATDRFGKDWGFWIGAGASYRFKLD